MRKLFAAVILLVFTCLLAPYIVSPAYAEPSITEVLDHLGFTDTTLVNDETFPAGTYEIVLYAEFAGYNEANNLSYYQVGTNEYNLIFDGPEGGFGYLSPPITKTITIVHMFGLSMATPENHRYFTQNGLNPDGQAHSIVYKNNDEPYMFLIGFENLYGLGDRDYQDMVFSLRLQTPSQMVPEVPLGTLMSAFTMILAFMGFIGFRRFRLSRKI